MKKKGKKAEELVRLKSKIADLEYKLEEAIGYKNRIGVLEEVVRGVRSYTYPDKRSLLEEVAELAAYKRWNEGAVRVDQQMVIEMRNIIRWMIDPETARDDKELEALKKQ